MTLSSSELITDCKFMIDSGSGLNLIKRKCLKPHVSLDMSNLLYLQGISPETVVTLGAISIPILGNLTEFHVISDSIGFPQDGILGHKFLEERAVIINYRDKYIQHQDTRIPFSKSGAIRLKGRTVTPCHFYIANPEKRTGYVPRQTPVKGVYFGEAIVNNINGKAYMPIFNTSEEELIFHIPLIQLQDYDTCDSVDNSNGTRGLSERLIEPLYSEICEPRGDLAKGIDNPIYFNQASPESTDRTADIIKLLRLEHLNPEESDSIRLLVYKHSDRFHLPDEHLQATNAAQHYIPTTNEVPVHTKQYRFPPVHKEEINRQVDELLLSDLIEASASPYNSPLWIVPKKPDSQGNKRWRMVIDYRNLNEKTIGDAYPLPNITDILDQL